MRNALAVPGIVRVGHKQGRRAYLVGTRAKTFQVGPPPRPGPEALVVVVHDFLADGMTIRPRSWLRGASDKFHRRLRNRKRESRRNGNSRSIFLLMILIS